MLSDKCWNRKVSSEVTLVSIKSKEGRDELPSAVRL